MCQPGPVFSSLTGMHGTTWDLEELRKALKTVCKFAAVVVGPLARQVWRLKASANAPRQCKSACVMSCESFAIGGRCEHAYTAVLAEKEIQLDTDWVKPDAAKGIRLWPPPRKREAPSRPYEPQLYRCRAGCCRRWQRGAHGATGAAGLACYAVSSPGPTWDLSGTHLERA